MALPNSNISTSLVGNTIGSGSRDVGTLCTHPDINKWSKWKPVKLNKVTSLSEIDLQSVDFGLIPAQSSTDYMDVIGTKWVYDAPTIGYNGPYRLGDFRNYFKDAPPLMSVPTAISYNSSNINSFNYTSSINRSGNNHIIGIDEFIGEVGGLYFGVVVRRGPIPSLITSDVTIGEGGNNIIFSMLNGSFSTSGTATLYNILCDYKVEELTALSFLPTNINYYPIPSSDASTDITSLSITSGSGLNTVVRKVSNSIAGPYVDIDDYISRFPDIFVTSGALYFEIDLIAGNIGATVQRSLYTLNANPTYFGVNNIDHAAEMYNGTNAITSMSVPAGQTRTIILGRANLINMDGSLPSTPQPGQDSASSLITIKYAGVMSDVFRMEFSAF